MLFLLVMPVKKPEIYFHTKCRWNMAIFRWDKILWFRKTNGCHIRILLLLMCSHRNVIFYLPAKFCGDPKRRCYDVISIFRMAAMESEIYFQVQV